jgi:hypothetical protein
MRTCPSWTERPIRWMIDDAAKFTAREVRRGRRYDGILLDPPKFGRGPTGEVWRLEEHLPGLIEDCGRLLDAQQPLPGADRLCRADERDQPWRTAAAEACASRRRSSRRDGGARGSARAAAADGAVRALGAPTRSARPQRRAATKGAPATRNRLTAASS